MSISSRDRLLALARLEFRPDAWRNQADVVDLLSQFHDVFSRLAREHGRWIPYTMPAVDVVRDALEAGTILLAVVPQVLEYTYIQALGRNRRRVRRSMIVMAINHQVHLAAA